MSKRQWTRRPEINLRVDSKRTALQCVLSITFLTVNLLASIFVLADEFDRSAILSMAHSSVANEQALVRFVCRFKVVEGYARSREQVESGKLEKITSSGSGVWARNGQEELFDYIADQPPQLSADGTIEPTLSESLIKSELFQARLTPLTKSMNLKPRDSAQMDATLNPWRMLGFYSSDTEFNSAGTTLAGYIEIAPKGVVFTSETVGAVTTVSIVEDDATNTMEFNSGKSDIAQRVTLSLKGKEAYAEACCVSTIEDDGAFFPTLVWYGRSEGPGLQSADKFPMKVKRWEVTRIDFREPNTEELTIRTEGEMQVNNPSNQYVLMDQGYAVSPSNLKEIDQALAFGTPLTATSETVHPGRRYLWMMGFLVFVGTAMLYWIVRNKSR